MGMDVYGKQPNSERGEYFRNNVWWWRPLWDYCVSVAPEVIGEETAEHGHYNDGAGLDADDALILADILRNELESGRTAEWERSNAEWRASLPREACSLCDCTGIRTDNIGIEHGMPEKELSPEIQILTGRTHGWCNACQGVGTVESWLSHYPFSTDNVREFAEFCAESGGFTIC